VNRSRAFSLAIALTVFFSGNGIAHQQSPIRQAPTGLALEVTFLKGRSPVLFPVPGPKAKPSGGWSGSFGRFADWQSPDGALPAKAVQVRSRLEGGVVEVQVSVLFGREAHEREELVATYDAALENPLVINDLTRLGIEPIEIKLVKVAQTMAVLPEIINQTKSVFVVGITPVNSTLPSYQLALQNLSSKDVAALYVYVLAGGTRKITTMQQGPEGRPLIPSGGQYELKVPAGYQVQPSDGNHSFDLSQDHECVIGAAVFSDGSYEGDPEPASTFRAFVRGRQVQLRRVVALLQQALDSTDEAKAALQGLKAGLLALTTEEDASEIDGLLSEFSTLPRDAAKANLGMAMRTAMGNIKMTATNQLEAFEKAQGPELEKYVWRLWLFETEGKYQRWLSRS
jgi:hypothetical protein